MISFLRGTVAAKSAGALLLDVGGVGYELHMAASSLERVPDPGAEATVLVVESFGMYGGGASLYGFAAAEERELFETLRDHVPATGAKKALEYMDKAARSLPDFRRAVLEKDARILAGVFGFSRKTADKLILALKDKLGPAPERAARAREPELLSPALSQVSSALAALGYRSTEVKGALQALREDGSALDAPVEELVRRALKRL